MTHSTAAFNGKTTSIVWIIKNFSSCIDYEKVFISSCQFAADKTGEKRWRLTLYRTSSMFIESRVELNALIGSDHIAVSVRVSIIDRNFNKTHEMHAIHSFHQECMTLHFPKFITDENIDPVDGLLHLGNLVLCCEITVDNVKGFKADGIPIEIPAPLPKYSVNQNPSATGNLVRSLDYLLRNKFFSDFTVYVEDKNYTCHKCVLASRSEYFLRLFTDCAEENHERKHTITDVEPDIFEKILRYIYTGEVDILDAEVYKLFLAADKFGLERLKIMCEVKLHPTLRLENATELFAFASVYNIHRLKTKSFLLITDFGVNIRGLEPPLTSQPLYAEENSSSQASDCHDAAPETTKNKKSGAKKYRRKASSKQKESSTSLDASCPERESLKKKSVLSEAQFWCRTVTRSFTEGSLIIENFKECDFTTVRTLCSHIVDLGEDKFLIEVRYEAMDCTCNLNIYLKLLPTKEERTILTLRYDMTVEFNEHRDVTIAKGMCDIRTDEYTKISITKYQRILSGQLLSGSDFFFDYMFDIVESTLYDWAPPIVPECDLIQHMVSLRNDDRFTDILVKVDDQTFECHKAILASNSPYFASKLQQNISSEEILEVDGVEPSTFEKILSAMYTGKCELTESQVRELIPFARKYRLSEVTATFYDAFVSVLSIESAVRTLIYVDSLKSEVIKHYIITFIAKNLEKVMATSDWSHLAKNEELFIACLKEHVSQADGYYSYVNGSKWKPGIRFF